MARPRTPTNVLALRGAFDKDPKRGEARANEPPPNGDVGEPPETLLPSQKAAWDYIVSCCAPGVLCRADRVALEVAAVIFAEFRCAPADMPAARVALLNKTLSCFGMNPADRSKVGVPTKPKENSFSAFVGKKKG